VLFQVIFKIIVHSVSFVYFDVVGLADTRFIYIPKLVWALKHTSWRQTVMLKRRLRVNP